MKGGGGGSSCGVHKVRSAAKAELPQWLSRLKALQFGSDTQRTAVLSPPDNKSLMLRAASCRAHQKVATLAPVRSTTGLASKKGREWESNMKMRDFGLQQIHEQIADFRSPNFGEGNLDENSVGNRWTWTGWR